MPKAKRPTPSDQGQATEAPKLRPPRLGTLTPGDAASLSSGGSYDGLRFGPTDIGDRDLRDSAFDGCSFEDLRADQADFDSAQFREVRFERLVASGLRAPDASFEDVEILGSRIGAAEWYGATLWSVLVDNSKLGFVNLRGAQIRDVLFRHCTIDELDLGGASAERVAFVDCRIESLQLGKAKLRHVDLRGLAFGQVSGLDGLGGATISALQAMELAPAMAMHLGVRIEP